MLSYLCGTRPDILFATHSAARFSVDPKLSHELALKRIGKYLAATKDKGIIMTPDASKGVECYVDASFVGDYCEQRSDDKSTLYSRTGYVIFFWAVLSLGFPRCRRKSLFQLQKLNMLL